MNERFLQLSQLGKTYATQHGPAVIVKDFDLYLREGEFVCVIGHSGCGKSTVLSIVMGLIDATEGGVILAGREVVGPGTDRGVVFQSPALLPWLTARGNVLLAVEQADGRHGRAERHKLAEHYLALVGLAEVADRYPDELSAGMRQRVGIGRAFALEPKVLLLDRRGDSGGPLPAPQMPCGCAQPPRVLPVARPSHRVSGRARRHEGLSHVRVTEDPVPLLWSGLRPLGADRGRRSRAG